MTIIIIGAAIGGCLVTKSILLQFLKYFQSQVFRISLKFEKSAG